MRQWDKGILVGIYEIDHEHWAIDGAPWDFGMELFKEDFDRIENELALSFERYPDLKNVGIKKLGKWSVHIFSRWEPSCRARKRPEKLLACLWCHGRLSSGRWRWKNTS